MTVFLPVLLTYALHSTVLLGLAWALDRWLVRSPAARESLWKSAVVAGVVSAAFSISWFGPPPEPILAELLREGVPTRWLEGGGAFLESESSRQTWVVERSCIEGFSPRSSGLASGPDGFLRRLDACNRPGQSARGWLVALWALISGLLVIRWVLGMSQMARLVGQGRVSRRTARGAVVRIVSGSGGPVAVGRSTILVSDYAVREFSDPELSAAIAHEEAHLERSDPFWCWGLQLLSALAFFQPLNRLALSRINHASEILSDESTTTRGVEPLDLARAIEKAASWTSPSGLVMAPGLARSGGRTAARVGRLLTPQRGGDAPAYNIRRALICLLFAVAALLPRIGGRTGELASVEVVIKSGVGPFEAERLPLPRY